MPKIQLRHDTATNWTTANPILAEGEVGVETDTNKMKIGDGVTSWNSLAYFVGDIDGITITKNSDDELQTIGVIDDNVQNAYNFTVVGSPTITDDGIASGFSSSNYITNNLQALGSQPFKIVTKVNTGEAGTDRYICKLGTSSQSVLLYKSVLLINQNNNLVFWTVVNDGNNTDVTPQYYNIPANTDLFVKVEWDGNYYWVSISYDGKTWLDSTKRASTYPLITYNQSGIYIGYLGTATGVYASGSIDLKQFSITVDGVEVYRAWQPPALKYWTGTKAQYDAIVTKDATTLYFLSDVGKIYFGDTLISNVGNNTLLDFKWADHQLNDIQWLRADTFSWQSGDVYTSAYNHLVQDIQGITAETETIGSYTVTFYRATDGHKICLADQEQTVLNIYNTYGIAWYYILDTTNTQFKLPHTKYGFEGLRTNVGDIIAESLPNIKAVASSAYQDNAPVQERATQMYLYFYVGEYSQTAIEQTAGLNAELFNGKADVDLSNCTKPHIVETYVNGSSWYRVYSDGWCEQGGFISSGSTTGNVIFVKQFQDTNYSIITQCQLVSSSYGYQAGIFNPTTSGFNWRNSGSDYATYWQACGYIN